MLDEIQLLGLQVIVDIPYEAMHRKGAKGEPDIKLDSIQGKNRFFKVLKVGKDVPDYILKEGDEVMFFDGVDRVEIFEKEYIMIQYFDIKLRKKREVETKGEDSSLVTKPLFEDDWETSNIDKALKEIKAYEDKPQIE